jgi:hypothetical protein
MEKLSWMTRKRLDGGQKNPEDRHKKPLSVTTSPLGMR